MRTLYLLSLVLCISCSKKTEQSDDLVFHKPDQIDYYYLDVSEEQLAAMFKSENMSRHQRQMAQILHHSAPSVISDTAFVAEMDEMPYFQKATVEKKIKNKILSSFEPHDDMLSASFVGSAKTCAPTYRDILIFRERKKIIGFAKVCFECSQTHLVGSKFEAVHTDYKTLEKALNKVPRN